MLSLTSLHGNHCGGFACQKRLFEKQNTPGVCQMKTPNQFYFPENDQFWVREIKTDFENGFGHPGGVLLFK